MSTTNRVEVSKSARDPRMGMTLGELGEFVRRAETAGIPYSVPVRDLKTNIRAGLKTITVSFDTVTPEDKS